MTRDEFIHAIVLSRINQAKEFPLPPSVRNLALCAQDAAAEVARVAPFEGETPSRAFAIYDDATCKFWGTSNGVRGWQERIENAKTWHRSNDAALFLRRLEMVPTQKPGKPSIVEVAVTSPAKGVEP
jgi:hypothetical protein